MADPFAELGFEPDKRFDELGFSEEASAPQIGAVPGLQMLHAINRSQEEAAYKPSWTEAYQQGGLLGVGRELVKDVGAAVSETPERLGSMITGAPTMLKEALIRPAALGKQMIESTTEPLISPRTTGKAITSGVLDTAAMAGAGAALGVAVPTVGKALAQTPYRMTTQRASKAINRLTRALAVPDSEAPRFVRSAREAVSHIYDYSKREGRQWNSVEGFAKTARDASDEFYNKNYSDLSRAFQNTEVKGAPVGDAIREIKANLRPEQSNLRESIEGLAQQYSGRDFSIEQLESFRKSLNGELEGMEKLHNLDRAQLVKANPAAAAMDRQQKSIRRVINTTLDHVGRRYEGATAGVLRTYRSMLDVVERAERRAPAVALEKMHKGGKRLGPESLLTPIRGVAMRQANPLAAAAGQSFVETGTLLNTPDRLVQSARHLLDKHGFGPRGSGALAQPIPLARRPQLALPEAGELSIGDLRYRIPDDRAAAKYARQRQEGSRLLTGQTSEGFANQPRPGEPAPLSPGEMELSPGQIPSRPTAARPSPITIGPPPDIRVKGAPPSKPRIRVPAAPVQGQTVPISVEPVPNPYLGPERRRAQLDPAIIEESRRRALQSGLENWEKRLQRRTIGEGATPSEADWYRYRLGDPRTADFIEMMDRIRKHE